MDINGTNIHNDQTMSISVFQSLSLLQSEYQLNLSVNCQWVCISEVDSRKLTLSENLQQRTCHSDFQLAALTLCFLCC